MSNKLPIYLDYNATTPHDPEVVSAIQPFLDADFGNPSSSHTYGVRADSAVSEARRQVADLLCCSPDEVVFTGGGSESNNMAIKGVVLARKERGSHIITSQIEHSAVEEVCSFLGDMGFLITFLRVDENGRVDVKDVERAITPKTVLISIMQANNEVGTIQPIEAIGRIARERGIWFHTDAAQSVGKIAVDVNELGVDLLSVAGHKVYAPKGIGALYIREGTKLEKFMHGAGHERNRRAGTENVMGIVGLGKACEIAVRDLEKNRKKMKATRDRLQAGLQNCGYDVRVNGDPVHRLPNTLSISFRGIEANALLASIQDRVAASTGSACHSGEVALSTVLKAMGVTKDWGMGTLRLSTGRMTTESDIDQAIDAILEGLKQVPETFTNGGKNGT